MSDETIEQSQEMSKREAGKADRRRRIVEAARALIRETGDTGLSMRAIAARANVSLATPYNLFGSKRAIVLAVLDDVREFQERFANLTKLDAVDRIFAALSLTMSYYSAEPEFYRTVWNSLLDTAGSAELRAELVPPQSEMFWRRLLDEAARDGALDEAIDLDMLQRTLGNVFAGVMLSWVMGGSETGELEPAVCYGYASVLCGAATDSSRPALRAHMLKYQKTLARLRRAAANR